MQIVPISPIQKWTKAERREEKRRENKEKKCHAFGFRCQVSGVNCQVSGFRCPVSRVACHMSPKFFISTLGFVVEFVLVLLFIHIEQFSVSRMQDSFKGLRLHS